MQQQVLTPPTWDQLRLELEWTCSRLERLWREMGIVSNAGDWRDWAREQIRLREQEAEVDRAHL